MGGYGCLFCCLLLRCVSGCYFVLLGGCGAGSVAFSWCVYYVLVWVVLGVLFVVLIVSCLCAFFWLSGGWYLC